MHNELSQAYRKLLLLAAFVFSSPFLISSMGQRIGTGLNPYCPAPRSKITAGYAFLSRDNGFEKEHYNGGQVTYTRHFGLYEDVNDTLAGIRPVMQRIGIGAGLMYVFFKDGELKTNLTAFTAGPEYQVNVKSFVFVLGVQGGIATQTFKFGDIKDSESKFALKPSLGVEYNFNNKFGISVAAQGLYMKVDDDGADFFFGGCTALCLRFGHSHRIKRD